MNRNVSHGVARFRCMTRVYFPGNCQCPSVRETALEAAVLKAVQEQIQELVDEAKFRLYDNLEKGIIDQDEYTRFKTKYSDGIAEQESQIEGLRASMVNLKEALRQDDEFVSYFEEYGSINVIDRNVLERLLDHISVEDGTHVHVYFKFSPERKKPLDFVRTIEDMGESSVCQRTFGENS